MVIEIRRPSSLFGCIDKASLISLNNLYFVDNDFAFDVFQGKIMSKQKTKTKPSGVRQISSKDEEAKDPILIF